MAVEFHHKTAALFEEFKKRELCYLDIEKKTSGNFSWKNEFNMPTQAYLEKINKREKETEKIYKDLMNHLEDFDKRTDQMSLKLEKLNALKNIAISNNTVSWSSVEETFGHSLQPPVHYTSNNTILPSIHSFHPLLEVNNSLTKFRTLSASTQTEYVFCDQCHSPLNMYSNSSRLMKSSIISNENTNNELNEPYFSAGTTQPSSSLILNDSDTKELETDKSKMIKANVDYPQSQEHLNSNNSIPSRSEVLSSNSDVNMNQTFSKLDYGTTDREPSEVNQIKTESNVATLEKIQPLETDNIMSTTETLDEVVAKSDDESMNHEFDFLESDKRNSEKNEVSQFINEVPQTHTTEINPNFNKTNRSIDMRKNSSDSKGISISNNHSKPELPKQISNDDFVNDIKDKDSIKIIDDLKPDSSVSIGAPSPSLHSENASESDSFSEKETPLTATAAYQALLGNVSVAKTLQNRRPVTDSDTEDEIENALATAVRKNSNVIFDAGVMNPKPNSRKESIAESKPKPDSKTSNIVSKPQNKLSKNTRKVLGLDTSSGSEIELPTKADAKQTAEDSDEFDFYD